MIANVELWWYDNWQGKAEVFGGEPASVQLDPLRIPRILTRG
jgi:hypothetical protein